MRRLKPIGLILIATLLAAVACGGEGLIEVRGLVVEVRASSLTQLDALTIRDGDGRLWAFRVEGFLGFTPSHLREHQVRAESVSVRFKETSDGLLAVSVVDAP